MRNTPIIIQNEEKNESTWNGHGYSNVRWRNNGKYYVKHNDNAVDNKYVVP